MTSEFRSRYTELKRKLFDKAYSDLNDRQREAVFSVRGPLLVLAGAGSGKTTVLVRRIAHMIKYGDAYFSDRVPEDADEETLAEYEAALENLSADEIMPLLDDFAERKVPAWSVLAITFTNKAANEMKSRLAALLGGEEGDAGTEVTAGTFHSVCLKFLRVHAEKLGYLPRFVIYDAQDTKKLISEIEKDLGIAEDRLTPKECMTAIGSCKDSLGTPEDFRLSCRNDKDHEICDVYEEYQKRLMRANAMDFDDIIVNAVRLFETFPEIAAGYRRKYRYICVDEYQDTNYAQFKLCEALARDTENIMVVGDDDQSIYAFRGATVENILGFDRVYASAKVIKLEQNYRSTSNILNAANGVISHNSARHGKKLWTDGETGAKVRCVRVSDQTDEARYICDTIVKDVASGKCRYSDNAVLYRVNAQANALETAFARSGVPCRVLGGLGFYERKEIKDILAYLCVIDNHGDALRLRRIVNEPKREIGSKAVETADRLASELDISLYDAMKRASEFDLVRPFAAKYAKFTSVIDSLTAIAQNAGVAEIIRKTIELTGYGKMIEDMGREEQDRLDNLKEFVSSGVEYDASHENGGSLTGFLEELSLVTDIDKYDEAEDAVVLMTIHSAKGLEFVNVFLPGMEQGLFPSERALEEAGGISEERRLAYVAITRAKKTLTVLHADSRLLYGKTSSRTLPSQFISEIPDQYKTEEDRRDRTSYGTGPAYGHDWGGSFSGSRGGYRRESFRSAAPDPPRAAALPSYPKQKKPAAFFTVGQRIVHPTFGSGRVTKTTPMGSDCLYDILFDSGVTKKIMANYTDIRKE